ncbi:MAG: alpha-amylase family glycosyl hydrolase [Polyangiales bacterium]
MNRFCAACAIALVFSGCAGGGSGAPNNPLPDVGVGPLLDGGGDGTVVDGTTPDGTTGDGSPESASESGTDTLVGDGTSPDALASALLPVRDCKTSFRLANPTGETVQVFGEWDGFAGKTAMLDGLGTGTYRAELAIAPGEWGYKFIVNGTTYLEDPANATERYVGGVANSRVNVGDCHRPMLTVTSATATPSGTIDLALQYVAGVDATSGKAIAPNPSTLAVTMAGASVPASALALDPSTGVITVHMTGLSPTKYTFDVNVNDVAGAAADDLLIPMWVEAEPFEWTDGPLYFVFTDRFVNGDTTNDGTVAGVQPTANYQGGDYAGVLTKLKAGYFDALGVRTIWMSPVNMNTHGGFSGTDSYMFSGYHGYWVTKARDVESHWGSLADLKSVVAEAHKHGIRIIFDVAQNQLHQEHDYVAAHKADGWFNNIDSPCICGTSACGWNDDVNNKTCWFAPYLPDVNWTNMDAVHAMIGDAQWWLEQTDADGFRVDAVKHMNDIATTSLRAMVNARFGQGNARYYTVGETATGSGASDRALISHYIGPDWLAGQLDFPLYFGIDYAFSQSGGSMSDLDNAVVAGETSYPVGAAMAPFLGSQDDARFLSRANGDVVGDTTAQAFTSPPAAPTTVAPYNKLFLAQVFLLTQPGLPLIYYGDEYGQPGTGDPDNRRFMRFDSALSANEAALLAKVKVVAKARGTLAGLRRGARTTLYTDGDGYVYARGATIDAVIVALNRGTTSRTVHVTVPASLSIPDGTTLHDLYGGPSVTVSGGAFDAPLTPQGASLWTK